MGEVSRDPEDIHRGAIFSLWISFRRGIVEVVLRVVPICPGTEGVD